MQTYSVNEKKRKQALKQLVKENRKALKGFPKACYYIAIILKIAAILCGSANLLHMILWSRKWYEMFLLPITFVIPYCISFLPQAVYVGVIEREFRFRRRETMTFKPDGFLYCYHDDRVGNVDSVFAYDIKYSQIEKMERNEKTKILTCYGNFVTDTYSGDQITQTLECRVFDFMDVYDIDIKQQLENNIGIAGQSFIVK